MRGLLDTHTTIWATLAPELLSAAAAAFIADEENEIYVSAASAWELATKVRIGKMQVGEALERDLLAVMKTANFLLLPIDVETALLAGRMRGIHKDPFDRMIAAQALAWNMPVISTDAKLDEFGVRRIW